jgi:gliding motility-associated-like protein
MPKKSACALLLSLILASLTFPSRGQIITTFAGKAPPPYLASSGDGGPALNANIGGMYHGSVAFDASGNMYLASMESNSVRKVDAAGIITTIAGNGTIGYTGDGGPAINALLYHPGSVIVDNGGNIIFADQNGEVLRQIDPAGIITTISAPYTGACAGEGVPLSQAVITEIYGLSKDNAGNIYVSDQACNTVRKISTSRIVTTVAGNGTYGFSGDGGPATSAQLAYPGQVGIDNAGNIYIPDCQNLRIRKVSTGGTITTIGGNSVNASTGDGGPAAAAEFALPISICVDNSGNIYVAESYGYVVRKIDASAIVTDYAGNYSYGYSGDGGPASLAQVTEIENIDMDAAGNLYIVDYDNQVIRKVNNCLTATFSSQPADVSLCTTGNATFSTTASNANSLRWQINSGTGWTDLTDNGVYSGSVTNTLSVTGVDATMNTNQFRCVANNSCGNMYTLPASLTVLTPVVPSITISTAASTICSGAPTLFQAMPANGGTTPTYQWQKNNLNVGGNSPTYIDANIADGDIITCLLGSTATCITTSSATSNALTMTVDPVLTAAVSISASVNGICAGAPVTFTASPVNEGTNPTYQWYKNTTPIGANSAAYTADNLQNGDAVSCTLTPSYSCLTAPNAASNTVTMNVTALVTPAITIGQSGPTACEGSPATFDAAVQYGGSGPVYAWQKNGAATGDSGPQYVDNNASAGDMISCDLTSNGTCLTTPASTSNIVPVALLPNPVVTLDQNPGLCIDSARILDAGPYASFLWQDGSTAETFTVTGPGVYAVTVTDDNGCKGTGSTTVSTILPLPGNFLPPDTTMCSYGSLKLTAGSGYSSYLWSDNSSGSSISITKPGSYWLQVTDNNNCTGRDTIVVGGRECLEGFYVPTAFTPNNDGNNDFFKPVLLGNISQYQFAIFNRWGQSVFESKNPTQGWDGNLKGESQPAGTFVWICTYQLAGTAVVTKRGTVILIR